MHHIFFVDQVKRSKKTVVYFCLLLVAAAFFVSSINLYQNPVVKVGFSDGIDQMENISTRWESLPGS